MTGETVAAALEREHREIDEGIAAFVSGLERGRTLVEPFRRATAALRRHIYIEETFLFPPMRPTGLAAAVAVMIREHGRLWRLMDELAGLTGSNADPTILRERCRALIEALEAHNFKEERVVYPQADAALPTDAGRDVRAFLASGTPPDGWVCQAAGGR